MPMRSANRPARRAACLLAALLACPAAGAGAASVVVPNGSTLIEGNTNFTAPFSCASSGFSSMRFQQVYLGSEIDLMGPITEIRFRRDGSVSPGFAAATLPGVVIVLSSTPKAPDGLSATFAGNLGGDKKTVFSGDLTLSSAASGPGSPKPFDVRIPLQEPFDFAPESGLNLLLDVTIPVCKATNAFDAVDSAGDSVSTMIATSAGASEPNPAFLRTVGLVTQLVSDTADDTLLLQDGGRFTVRVAWRDHANQEGVGHARNLTADAGTFWFFDAANVELIVKVLDACAPPFNRYWLFAAGLTDVEVTITVTDTQTGAAKEYRNPRGRPFAPILDTGAFATCP